ncbi:MAG: hypothetical protein GX604_00070 [Actinobacteria bacterium]|nr:hypothetical protein [Actinomycetota bacterium]
MMKGGEGLSAEQEQAQGRVREFVADLMDLSAFEPATFSWKPWDCTALAVFSTSAEKGGIPQPDVEPNRLAWPLAGLDKLGELVAPEGYRRFVVSGADFETLKPLLAQATQITRWDSGGHEHLLFFRPLLPDEADQTRVTYSADTRFRLRSF